MASETPELATRRPRLGAWGLVPTLAIIFAGAALEYPRYEATFTPARCFFWGPDDYTHVYRAKIIARGEARRIRLMPEINHPRGVELHWTAPMDYLLAGAGLLAGPLIHHPDPIGVASAWVPVVLGALYVLVMMNWVRRRFGLGPALLVGMFVILSPPFHRVFALGHPDHHALLELLFVVAIGAWAPAIRKSDATDAPGRRTAIASGLAAGLAIWVAPQALMVWAAILIGANFACHRGDLATRKMYIAARFWWNLSVAAAVMVAWLVENWPDLDAAFIDKVGSLQLALVLIAMLIPATLPRAPGGQGQEKADRAKDHDPSPASGQAHVTQTIALLAAVAAFTVWFAVHFHSAVQYVNRPAFFRWSENIEELRPLLTHVGGRWSLRLMYDRLGYLPFAMPALWPFFLMSKRVPAALKCTLGLLAPLLTIMAIAQLRWMDHYNLAVVPVAVIGLYEVLRRTAARLVSDRPILLASTAGLALVLLTHPACRRILDRRSEDELAAQAPLKRTDFVAQSITEYEHRTGPSPAGRRAILCEDGEGPMLLYYTGLPVVAAPYHRAIDGIVEAAEFYAQQDSSEARAQLDRLGVRYIVMPAHPNEQLMNFERIVFGKLRSFDPPAEAINRLGRIVRTLHYRREQVARTMIYRLAMEPEKACIRGVELIGRIQDDPRRPKALDGLLYAVRDLPSSG